MVILQKSSKFLKDSITSFTIVMISIGSWVLKLLVSPLRILLVVALVIWFLRRSIFIPLMMIALLLKTQLAMRSMHLSSTLRISSVHPLHYSSNTLYDPYRDGADFVRGYPFSLREGVPTAVSHGLWLSIPDYDAPTQRVKPHERHMSSFQINVCSAQGRIDYLMSLGVKHKDIRRILLRQPQLLEYTVENNLKTHVAFLMGLGSVS